MDVLRRQRRFTLAAFIVSALAAFIAESMIDQVWRGMAPTKAPTIVHVVIAAAFGLLWLAPLVMWISSVGSYGGRLMRSALPATAAVVFTWGFFAMFFMAQFSHRTDLWTIFLQAVLSGFAAVAGTRIVNRHRLASVAIAAFAGWVASRAIDATTGVTARSLHDAHLRGFLSAIRFEDRAFWTLGFVVAVAVAVLYGMDAILDSLRRATRSSADVPTRRPVLSSDTAEFATMSKSKDGAQPGFYARQKNAAVEDAELQLREAKRAAEKAARGDEAERALFAETAVLAESGWKLEHNYFLEGIKIGDVDLLAISPGGEVFAVDAKLRTGATIVLDDSSNDLVASFPSGKRDEGEFTRKARYQADVLTKHSGRKVRPVICFINANLSCPRQINGVVVTSLDQVVRELRDMVAI